VPGDPTHTRIERLSESERREEVERMLGGAEFLEKVAQQ
jgi:DNA repair ATPase RecN